jgi:hypothetical protein
VVSGIHSQMRVSGLRDPAQLSFLRNFKLHRYGPSRHLVVVVVQHPKKTARRGVAMSA